MPAVAFDIVLKVAIGCYALGMATGILSCVWAFKEKK